MPHKLPRRGMRKATNKVTSYKRKSPMGKKKNPMSKGSRSGSRY